MNGSGCVWWRRCSGVRGRSRVTSRRVCTHGPASEQFTIVNAVSALWPCDDDDHRGDRARHGDDDERLVVAGPTAASRAAREHGCRDRNAVIARTTTGPNHGLRGQRFPAIATRTSGWGQQAFSPEWRLKTPQLEEAWYIPRRTRRSTASTCGLCEAWWPARRAETLRRRPLPSGHDRQARPGWFRREGRRSVLVDAVPPLAAGHAVSARLLLGSWGAGAARGPK